eukprot:SAG31_NODE_16527_length_705_cov_1.531353_2_plen_59_part_00
MVPMIPMIRILAIGDVPLRLRQLTRHASRSMHCLPMRSRGISFEKWSRFMSSKFSKFT